MKTAKYLAPVTLAVRTLPDRSVWTSCHGSVGRSAGVDGAGRLAPRALAVIQTGHVIDFKHFDVGGVMPSISS
jgi:hypothetical protein